MAFQMGHQSFVEQEPTQAEIDDILRQMDDQFDLILIADHLPESLILLRHQLCLSINEITSLSKNVAKRKHSNDDMKQKISEWETIDQPIFEKGEFYSILLPIDFRSQLTKGRGGLEFSFVIESDRNRTE